jgi:hypothetical protein
MSVSASEWPETSDRNEISPASVWAAHYEDESTLKSKPVAAKGVEQIIAVSVEESRVKTAARARILDESQVLPGEVSFATVTLNQPLEPTSVKGRGQVTPSRVEEFVNQAGPRPRILDESQVLPGEASFATVMLNPPIAARTYSPLAEFFAKSNLAWRRQAVPALLLVSIFAVSAAITLLILRTTEGDGFSAYPTANTSADISSPQAQPTTAQTEITPNSLKTGSVSDGEKRISGPVASSPVGATKLNGAAEVAHDRFPKAAKSERSRNRASNDAKLKTTRNVASQDPKSVASKAASARESGKRRMPVSQRQVSVKEAVVRKKAVPIERDDVKSSSSETVVRHRDSSPWSGNAAAAQSKGELKSAPATGGGQRPRSVARKVDP